MAFRLEYVPPGVGLVYPLQAFLGTEGGIYWHADNVANVSRFFDTTHRLLLDDACILKSPRGGLPPVHVLRHGRVVRTLHHSPDPRAREFGALLDSPHTHVRHVQVNPNPFQVSKQNVVRICNDDQELMAQPFHLWMCRYQNHVIIKRYCEGMKSPYFD